MKSIYLGRLRSFLIFLAAIMSLVILSMFLTPMTPLVQATPASNPAGWAVGTQDITVTYEGSDPSGVNRSIGASAIWHAGAGHNERHIQAISSTMLENSALGHDTNQAYKTNNAYTPVSTGPTNISGPIDTDTTWSPDGSPYVVNGTVTISAGVTLTLLPDTVVKFQTSASRLLVNGTLKAEGTESKPIYFTSIKDDSVGGDTNGDGDASLPAKGDWVGINVLAGGNAVIDHAVIRYGGATHWLGISALLQVNDGGKLVVTNALLEHSKTYGIYVNKRETAVVIHPEIHNNIINDCSYPIYIVNHGGYTGQYRMTGNTGANNTHNYIRLPNKLVGDVKFGASNSLELVFDGNVNLAEGAVWELDPGEVIKFSSSSMRFDVHGSLITKGSVDDPVVFTSINDHQYGQTIGTGEPKKGDWVGINVMDGGNAAIDHTVIRYGGSTHWLGISALLQVNDGGKLVVTNALLEHSKTYGIYVNKRETAVVIHPEIHNNIINDCLYPIYIVNHGGYTGQYRMTGNTGVDNTHNYIRLPEKLVGNVKFGASNSLDLVFQGNVNLAVGAVWELDPGEVIKFSSSSMRFDVHGSLVTKGSVDDPVVFTSINDHQYGQPIGTDEPKKGDWVGINVMDGGNAAIDHTVIRYGGSTHWLDIAALLQVNDGGKLVVTNSILEHSATNGIYVNNSSTTINCSTIRDNSNSGLYNSSSQVTISQSSIYNNNAYGVRNVTSSIDVMAIGNWWGRPTGPFHPTANPDGEGNPVSDFVIFKPWLTSIPVCELKIFLPLITK